MDRDPQPPPEEREVAEPVQEVSPRKSRVASPALRLVCKGLLPSTFLLLAAGLCFGGYRLVQHVLELPFRSTNDALHKNDSPVRLDFLIPAGVYIDEKKTIEEVIRIRLSTKGSLSARWASALLDLVPAAYRGVANMLLYAFWSFCFMAFFRIFTFMGYGRALRTSLFLGGVNYYFMPDFLPGRADDAAFVGIPAGILLARMYLVRRRRRKRASARLEKHPAPERSEQSVTPRPDILFDRFHPGM